MACGHRIRTSWKSFYFSFGFWWIWTLFIASTWFNTVGHIIFVPYLWQGIVLGTEDTGKYKTKNCPLGVWYSTGGYKKYTSQVTDVWHDKKKKKNWIRKWKPTRGMFSSGWQGMESEEWPLPRRTEWSLWFPQEEGPGQREQQGQGPETEVGFTEIVEACTRKEGSKGESRRKRGQKNCIDPWRASLGSW